MGLFWTAPQALDLAKIASLHKKFTKRFSSTKSKWIRGLDSSKWWSYSRGAPPNMNWWRSKKLPTTATGYISHVPVCFFSFPSSPHALLFFPQRSPVTAPFPFPGGCSSPWPTLVGPLRGQRLSVLSLDLLHAAGGCVSPGGLLGRGHSSLGRLLGWGAWPPGRHSRQGLYLPGPARPLSGQRVTLLWPPRAPDHQLYVPILDG